MQHLNKDNILVEKEEDVKSFLADSVWGHLYSLSSEEEDLIYNNSLDSTIYDYMFCTWIKDEEAGKTYLYLDPEEITVLLVAEAMPADMPKELVRLLLIHRDEDVAEGAKAYTSILSSADDVLEAYNDGSFNVAMADVLVSDFAYPKDLYSLRVGLLEEDLSNYE